MRLRRFDHVMLLYLMIVALLVLVAARRLPLWPVHFAVVVGMAAGTVVFARWSGGAAESFRRWIGDWYPVGYIVVLFKQLHDLVPAVHSKSYDDLLFRWDAALFGMQAGELFDPVASVFLTEILRACWLSFFILPFFVIVPLYRRKDLARFSEAVFVLVLGWLLSFLGYFVLPALGPYYVAEPVSMPACIDFDGPTKWVAQKLRSIEGDMHDAFPSGHAIVALIVLWQARRHRLRGWPLLVPLVAGLVVGTVYLRYHYGVDVLAGFVVVAAVVWIRAKWPAPDVENRQV